MPSSPNWPLWTHACLNSATPSFIVAIVDVAMITWPYSNASRPDLNVNL